MKSNGFTIVMATKDNDEAMSKFYIDILGFEKNEMGGCEKHGLAFYFDRHSEASVVAKEPFRHMITLSVDDINKSMADLKSKGVEFVKEPKKEEWGGWFATFKDPDGNFIQLFHME